MAETTDRDSRTEEPTEKKIRDELERGNVPSSREMPIFVSLAATLIVASFVLEDGFGLLGVLLMRLLELPGTLSLHNGADAVALLHEIGKTTGLFLVPILVLLMVGGIVSSSIQNAPRIVFDRIVPDFERVSPSAGWHRIFGARGQVEFLKGAFKFIGVSVIVFMLLQAERDSLVNAMFLDANALPGMIHSIATRLLAAICIITALLVTADLLWSRIHWRNDLRMSRQEVKDEVKQSEGDPLMRARLRSLGLARVRKNMIAAVPRATLVIANPTHYAIALRYVREEAGAPIVLAKGKDLIALKIREIAEQHFIPVVEDKALARSMYDSVEIDRMIPPEFYRAVAELIHFLHAKKHRTATTK